MAPEESDLTEEQKQRIAEMIEEVNGIVAAVNPDLGRNYSKIRSAYQNGYDVTDLDPLRHEICLCIMFGLNQAAITLTNHMLEKLMKTALIHNHAINQPAGEQDDEPSAKALIDYLAEAKKRYSGNSLENNINAACTQKLITKEEKKQLKAIRSRFRDAFSHGDVDKTFGESETTVQAVKFGEGSEGIKVGQEENVQIAEFLLSAGIHQIELAKENAVPYFLYVDRLARSMIEKVGLNATD